MRRGTHWGIIIILIGLLYLLYFFHVFPHPGSWFNGGSIIYGILAVLFFYFTLSRRRVRGRIWSFYIFIIFTYLCLYHTKIFPWLNQIRQPWQLMLGLFIIFVGFYILIRGRIPVIRIENNSKNQTETTGYRQSSSFRKFVSLGRLSMPFSTNLPVFGKRLLGEINIGRGAWKLRSGEYWLGIGELRLNLATAHVDDGEYTILVHGWIGEIRILVPEGLDVRVEATLGMGEVQIFGDSHEGIIRYPVLYEDPAYGISKRRVRLLTQLRVGELTVMRV